MKLRKYSTLMILVAAFFTIVAVGSVWAQTPPTAQNEPITRTVVDDDSHDYGWIGLIGLAGLLGLMPRKRTVNVHRDEAGVPRAAAR